MNMNARNQYLKVLQAMEVENYVKKGWFSSEGEVMRVALQEFIRTHHLKLMEQFMKEDIEWALKFKKAKT